MWATWHSALSQGAGPPRARGPAWFPYAWTAWVPLAVLTALAVAQIVGNGRDWLTLFIFVGASAGAGFPARSAVGAVAALALLTISVGWLTHAAPSLVGPTVVLVVFVRVIGISLVQVVATNRALRSAREEIARLAVAAERLRFARDLHDLLGHNLAHIALKSEVAEALVPAAPERVIAAMREAGGVARTALQEVRAIVSGYRQPTLANELRGTAEMLAAASVAYHCEGTEVTLPPTMEAVLAWTVREVVTNIVRHSRATRCTARLRQQGDSVCLEIANDGRAVADTALPATSRIGGGGGNGLAGVRRERVAAAGGCCAAGPTPEGGFHLSVALPLTTIAGARGAGRGAKDASSQHR